MDEYCLSSGITDQPESWANVCKLTPYPQTLFHCVFPALAKFLARKPHLLLGCYATTNGTEINFLFVNRRKHLKSDNICDHPLEIGTEKTADSSVDGRMPFTLAAGVRRLGGGLNRRINGHVTRGCGIVDLEQEFANGSLRNGIAMSSSANGSANKCARKR